MSEEEERSKLWKKIRENPDHAHSGGTDGDSGGKHKRDEERWGELIAEVKEAKKEIWWLSTFLVKLPLFIGCIWLILWLIATECSGTKSKPAGKFGPPPEGVEDLPDLEGLGPMKEKD